MNDKQLFAHMRHVVYAYTVPIKLDASTSDDQLGSGVLIEVAGRLFVATAKHCIEDNPILLEDKFKYPTKSNRIKILSIGRHASLDIGFLELQPNPDVPVISRGACTLEAMLFSKLPRWSSLHVVGFPGVLRSRRGSELDIVKSSFGSRLNKTDDSHLYLTYPRVGEQYNSATGKSTKCNFPSTPAGFSGGGCWAFLPVRAGELFNPQKNIRLIGIQCSWHSTKRYVKCVRIEHWFNFLIQTFPELSSACTGLNTIVRPKVTADQSKRNSGGKRK